MTDKIRAAWTWLMHWLEQGDLVPLMVIVSAAHYVDVLRDFGEHWLAAIAIGVLVDVGHFRTVIIASRYRFARGEKTQGRLSEFVIRWTVASVMTVISLSYHLRFYAMDLWLAIPMPLLIAALAYLGQKGAMTTARQADALSSDAERRKGRKDSATASEVAHVVASNEAKGKTACAWCARTFATPQALSAHLRFCDAYQVQKE